MSTHRRLWFLPVMVVLVVLLASGAILGLRSLLAVASADLRAAGGGPVFFDRYGRPIPFTSRERRLYVPLQEISPHLVQAVVAMEDARFFRHPGIDPVSIVRASISNLRGSRLQGASTITQQLAKNLFLSPERTWRRKIEEASLALALELRLSKDEILELYLNRIYLGEGAYGVQAAAKTYFGKDASQLTLGEAALLAGLLPAPNLYSPFRNPERALQRRQLVLNRLVELDLVDRQTATAAAREPLNLQPPDAGRAAYFLDFVIDRLVTHLGPELTFHGDLRVETTLDLRLQQVAHQALGDRQGAVVVLDLENGEILAMVGGRDYRESPFNRATHALRQPGSAFKPFVYAAALERGWTLASLLEDEPKAYGDYRPVNWDNRYRGKVTMKQAMAQSLNAASVWLLHQLGPAAALNLAWRLGIDTLTADDRHLALALGGLSRGVTPLRLAEAYTAFATGGILKRAKALRRVTDRDGREWPVREADGDRRVLSPEVAYLVTDMLTYALEEGTGTRARLGRPAAGKTGSTNDLRDAWFVGYTPRYLAAVYIGNDDNRPVAGGGGAVAAPVWQQVMAALTAQQPPEEFPVPPSIIPGVPIDAATGLRAGPGCEQQHPTAFIQGTEPHMWAPCSFPDEPEASDGEEGAEGIREGGPGDGSTTEDGRADGFGDPGTEEEGAGRQRGLLFLRSLFRRRDFDPLSGGSGPMADGHETQEHQAERQANED